MQQNNKNSWINFLPYLILIVAFFSLFNMNMGSSTQTVDYNALKSVIAEVEIDSATISVGYNVTTVRGVYQTSGRDVTFEA